MGLGNSLYWFVRYLLFRQLPIRKPLRSHAEGSRNFRQPR